jgi:hypothetical protein
MLSIFRAISSKSSCQEAFIFCTNQIVAIPKYKKSPASRSAPIPGTNGRMHQCKKTIDFFTTNVGKSSLILF